MKKCDNLPNYNEILVSKCGEYIVYAHNISTELIKIPQIQNQLTFLPVHITIITLKCHI